VKHVHATLVNAGNVPVIPVNVILATVLRNAQILAARRKRKNAINPSMGVLAWILPRLWEQLFLLEFLLDSQFTILARNKYNGICYMTVGVDCCTSNLLSSQYGR
jgi:hypothetical protein